MVKASKKRSSAKSLLKKTLSTKYDVVIKAKATSTRIVDISNVIVGLESNDKVKLLANTIREFTGTLWNRQCWQMEAQP